jgi:hypothetical protein
VGGDGGPAARERRTRQFANDSGEVAAVETFAPHALAAAGRDDALAAVPAEATELLDRAAGYILGGGGEIKAAAAVYQRAYDVLRNVRRRSPRHPHLGQQPGGELAR